jgi:hypothetical protein
MFSNAAVASVVGERRKHHAEEEMHMLRESTSLPSCADLKNFVTISVRRVGSWQQWKKEDTRRRRYKGVE